MPNSMDMKRPTASPMDEDSMRVLNLLSDAALRNCAGPSVFQRGRTYASSVAALDVQWTLAQDGSGVDAHATVEGTQHYAVELSVLTDEAVEKEGAVSGDCDCPQGQDGNFCKHQVALALVLRDILGRDAPEHSASAEKKEAAAAKRAKTQADKRNTLQAFVQSQSADDLALHVWEWAQTNRDVMADLKAWAAQAQAGKSPKALKTAITEMLKASGFLNWRAASDYARRAEKVLPLLERAMQSDPAEARALCGHALMRLYKVGGQTDDSNGMVSGVMSAVQGLLLRCLEAAKPPDSWLGDWFKLMQADPWGNWSERAVLDVAGPALQEAYSRKVAADWQAYVPDTAWTAHSRHYWDMNRWKLRRRYLEDLQHQGDPMAVIEAMRSSAQEAREHSELVEYCESQQKYREALQFAQARYKLFPTDHRAQSDLLRCYERDGWGEEALAMRRKQLKQSPTPAHFLAVLQAAKSAGKDVVAYRDALYQWAEAKERETKPVQRAMSPGELQRHQARHVGTRAEWLLAEGLVTQALALVQPPHVCQPKLLEQIASKLPQEQNEEAVQLLLRVFALEMPRADSPYREVLDLVREICKRMDSQPRKQWLLHLQAHYKAKRNFIKGLETL